MAKRLSSSQDYSTLLDAYDTWLFDCDGVLWHGMTLIDGALEVLQLLRAKSLLCSLSSEIFIRLSLQVSRHMLFWL